MSEKLPTGPFGPLSMKKFGKSGIETERYATGRGVHASSSVKPPRPVMRIGRMNASALKPVASTSRSSSCSRPSRVRTPSGSTVRGAPRHERHGHVLRHHRIARRVERGR